MDTILRENNGFLTFTFQQKTINHVCVIKEFIISYLLLFFQQQCIHLLKELLRYYGTSFDRYWLAAKYICGYKKDELFLKKRVVEGGVHDLNTLCPNTNGRKITDIFRKK